MKPKANLNLFEKILQLRLFAMTLYERALIQKTPMPTLTEHLRPITKELGVLIHTKAQTDIVECIEAMSMFEQMAIAHKSEAERLMQKAEDNMGYVTTIKDALIERMKTERVNQLRQDDHMIILNVVDGKSYLSYR